MALGSAQEDLRDTSLKAISGALNKLLYLADLRDKSTTYRHWGLARIHGERAANQALAEEHRELVSTLLATPIERLFEEFKRCSQLAGTTPGKYLEELCAKSNSLLPPDSSLASERHLNSVLCALSGLLKAQPDATRPV
jgi:hypothetical protein